MTNDESTVVERARELLDSSSTGVRAEMEQAEGWLKTARIAGEPDFWQVDAVAGALGDLANVWGRLTLWSRGNGTYPDVHDEMAQIMEELVDIRRRLREAEPLGNEVDRLWHMLEQTRHVHERVEAGDAGGDAGGGAAGDEAGGG